MDTPIPQLPADEATREEARAARKRWEREKIERGRRQMETGHFIEGDELDRWLDLYDSSDDPAPIPLYPTGPKIG
jgi:predicted transcriptional regulator